MNKKDNEQKVDTSIKSFLLPKISAEGIVIVAVFFAVAFFLLLLCLHFTFSVIQKDLHQKVKVW